MICIFRVERERVRWRSRLIVSFVTNKRYWDLNQIRVQNTLKEIEEMDDWARELFVFRRWENDRVTGDSHSPGADPGFWNGGWKYLKKSKKQILFHYLRDKSSIGVGGSSTFSAQICWHSLAPFFFQKAVANSPTLILQSTLMPFFYSSSPSESSSYFSTRVTNSIDLLGEI